MWQAPRRHADAAVAEAHRRPSVGLPVGWPAGRLDGLPVGRLGSSRVQGRQRTVGSAARPQRLLSDDHVGFSPSVNTTARPTAATRACGRFRAGRTGDSLASRWSPVENCIFIQYLSEVNPRRPNWVLVSPPVRAHPDRQHGAPAANRADPIRAGTSQISRRNRQTRRLRPLPFSAKQRHSRGRCRLANPWRHRSGSPGRRECPLRRAPRAIA